MCFYTLNYEGKKVFKGKANGLSCMKPRRKVKEQQQQTDERFNLAKRRCLYFMGFCKRSLHKLVFLNFF